MTSLAKLLQFGVAVAALAGAPAASAFAAQSHPPADDGKPAPPHTHTWVKQTRKEWVPPVKQTVQVGVDAKGKPIYETKIVKPGYWRTIPYFSCSCGATKQ
jgi:hypothetical protein